MGEKWNILAKYFSKESVNDSEKEYIDGVSATEDSKLEYKAAAKTMEKVDLYYDLKKIDTKAAWNKVSRQMETKTMKFRNKLIRVAAVGIILIATAFAVWRFSLISGKSTVYSADSNFETTQYELPDGSVVSLNKGAKLRFKKHFDDQIRLVKLTGEAFFTVARNVERPFVVETRNASVKVLGTSFNVYQGENTTEVFVKTGKVQLIQGTLADNSKNRIDLIPGQTGIFNNKQNKIVKRQAENENSLAWITRDITFNFTDLATVIETVKRVYNLKVDVEQSVDLKQQITATFNQQNADYIMEVVAITLDLDLTKTGATSYRIETN